ncbi:VWA domain-containing protein [Paucihalobacter ruber]|uniref:VWA domain-containing protein n=1 Tax=Paucihalobacter ruber TaxID=2567861 RepID=A0A506PEK9_9FLAO|nr:VWA domain-containing protein [Paucihalobacter ruber]TPV31507.1 VWA domain-containing protein [Paucihalobacter ruber]
MTNLTIFFIILSFGIALSLALFQYRVKSKISKKVSAYLAILRFVSIFTLLLLLINPKFQNTTYYSEKPNLVVAVDNSESIKYLNQHERAIDFLETVKSNSELNNRFNIEFYQFDSELYNLTETNFDKNQSDISKALSGLADIYKNSNTAITLLTDGNQTYGRDYQYSASTKKLPVFPLILGDTTKYADLKIQQLNVNKYAFLKNRFPVETVVVYDGNEAVSTQLKISSGDRILFSETINLDSKNNSKVVNTTILAENIGVKSYKVELLPLENEKNSTNNIKNFAVEVIDEKSNIAIVSTMMHPDLGVLKKSIETNEQRSAIILKVDEVLGQIEDYQLFVLYQPDASFKPLFDLLDQLELNSFIIAGTNTNWRFLNQVQTKFKQTITNQYENHQAAQNINFSNFIIDNLNFSNLPPLRSEFGECEIRVPHDILLFKVINGFETEEALLATTEINNQRQALLLGEDIWRWRAQSFLDDQSFNNFDNFMGKLVQYLSSNKLKSRLNIDYNSFYNSSDKIIISAQFFNKNYEFETNAKLVISLTNTESNQQFNYPLLLNNNNYVVDLNGLLAGDYNFIITEENENISKSGQIKILEFNIEQQFLNANAVKLQSLAGTNQGKAYFPNEVETLFYELINDKRFQITQKSTKNIVPLLDFKILLALLALSLGLEWFIRKYNGLI